MSASIVICADDYAISAGTSAVIRDLLAKGRINATTCLTQTAIWPAEAAALKALAAQKPGIAIGLHLNLTEVFGAEPGAARRPLGWWLRRALLPPAKPAVAAARAAYRRQWDAFMQAFGRPPDFVDGHQHVHLYGPARVALFMFLNEVGFAGWVRQCRTSGRRVLAQRILMDPMSTRLCHDARALGLAVNPGFGGLRAFRPGENLARIWGADLGGMAKKGGGLLIVHPGTAGSPRGTDAIDPLRIDEKRALESGMAENLMAKFGLSLALDARKSPWSGGD